MTVIRYFLMTAVFAATFCTSLSAKTIYFAGYNWMVKSGDNIGPGRIAGARTTCGSTKMAIFTWHSPDTVAGGIAPKYR
jgi:hypothetical protein